MEIIACYIAESDVPRDNHLYHFVTVVTCTGDLARKGTSALGPPITTIAAQKKNAHSLTRDETVIKYNILY